MIKKILITAKNSYIGNSFATWVAANDNFSIDFISCRTNDWKHTSFSKYDVIFHVAGIAHIKETKENADLYYKINRDLSYDVALKAKTEGVKQFIFLSTMSVYGLEHGKINKDTPINPKTSYGISKFQAESKIKELEDENFLIAILRPPIVYGRNCKGNYPKLAKLARILPVFPKINNQRSMIYIDNLSEFVKLLIENFKSGLYFPQNKEYVNTSEMVKLIAEVHGKHIWLAKLANPLINILGNKIGIVNKIFGNLVFDIELSSYIKNDYCIIDFERSIYLCEHSEFKDAN